MNTWHIPIAQDENSQWHVDWHGIPEGLCLGGNGRRFFQQPKKRPVWFWLQNSGKKTTLAACLFPGIMTTLLLEPTRISWDVAKLFFFLPSLFKYLVKGLPFIGAPWYSFWGERPYRTGDMTG